MDHDLHHLDVLIVRLLKAAQRPGYRARILDGVGTGPGMSTLRVLRAVERRANADEPASVNDVARELEVEQSTASRAVAAAIQGGFLERRACAQDQRRAQLELSSSGEAALGRATHNRQQILREVVQDLDDQEVRTLMDLLDRLLIGYDEVEGRQGHSG
ncbi:MarR family transcriptional regulator [Nocardioides sp. AE5]|uniref:MarR family winged helix-turn-helix transcriptional regulator n=1 Tax=Nocardioides sp. AE5 TaxID=2962573 RepID=UPI00288263F7|nr:MarR family transcriptional regulator [Nocardioides sp. AE5]MDT0202697.1 MarR family transcriptional regulator [Nocardioides sp. AE5]